MSEKKKYEVHRSMQDGATEYNRGDTREMTAGDAAPLIASGALSEPGKKPHVRDGGVTHAFGKAEGSSAEIVNPPRDPSVKVDDQRPAAKPKAK
jgi:hypothetical protein